MKGQITTEYLALFLVFMGILSLSLSVIGSIKDSSEQSAELLSFNAQINEIDQKISDVCSLGSGNKREVELSLGFSISYYEGGIQFSHKNSTISKSYPCSIEGEGSFDGILVIENDGGKILLGNK